MSTGRRVGVVGVVATLTLAVGGCTSRDPAPSAADQVPHLSVSLERVDAALAAHRFAVAREQLRKLKAEVVQARDSGELPDGDAERVLAAASKLLGMLPDAPAPTPTPTPTHQLTPTPTPSRPSGTKSSKPVVKPTPTLATTPLPATPTPTSPSASPTNTSTPTPTAVPTREANPSSSPTPTP